MILRLLATLASAVVTGLAFYMVWFTCVTFAALTHS